MTTEVPEKTKIDSHHVKMMVNTEVPEMTTEDLEITTEDPDQTINQTELHEERVLKIKLKEISYKTNQ